MKARQRVVGSPWSLSSVQGPQINKTQFDKILAYIKAGEEEGAVLEAGGGGTATSATSSSPPSSPGSRTP